PSSFILHPSDEWRCVVQPPAPAGAGSPDAAPPPAPASGPAAARPRAGPGPGGAAAALVWLPPRADSLLALARAPGPDPWQAVRPDPGAVLLLLREAAAARTLPAALPALLPDPALLDGALRYLDQASPDHRAGGTPPAAGCRLPAFPDWQLPAV